MSVSVFFPCRDSSMKQGKECTSHQSKFYSDQIYRGPESHTVHKTRNMIQKDHGISELLEGHKLSSGNEDYAFSVI